MDGYTPDVFTKGGRADLLRRGSCSMVVPLVLIAGAFACFTSVATAARPIISASQLQRSTPALPLGLWRRLNALQNTEAVGEDAAGASDQLTFAVPGELYTVSRLLTQGRMLLTFPCRRTSSTSSSRTTRSFRPRFPTRRSNRGAEGKERVGGE